MKCENCENSACDSCGLCHCGWSYWNLEWRKVKEALPPFGEVVEVYVSGRLNGVKLDHAAYMKADKFYGKNYWTFDGMDEFSWSDKGFEIKYWRFLRPLPNKTKPYILATRWGALKVVFKRELKKTYPDKIEDNEIE